MMSKQFWHGHGSTASTRSSSSRSLSNLRSTRTSPERAQFQIPDYMSNPHRRDFTCGSTLSKRLSVIASRLVEKCVPVEGKSRRIDMNQNSKPKRCVLFARCNRDGNNSVQKQVKMMHAYSRQQRLHVVDVIQIKNQSAHGPEAAEALGQLCQRKTKHDDFDVLLTTDLSRLCRGPICRWIHLQKQLADAGVELVTLDHGHIDLRISITFHGGVPKKKKEWKLHN